MLLFILLGIFFVSLLTFIVMTSYPVQIELHRVSARRHCVYGFRQQVKGRYRSSGYFGISHRIISPKQFKNLSRRHRSNFYHCYNIVTFKTAEADWEVFFYLIREGVHYSENMGIRCFPRHQVMIKSEGNAERVRGGINVFSNNRYLAEVLEEKDNRELLDTLLRHEYDMLQVLPNNLYSKSFLDKRRQTMSAQRMLEMIRNMDRIRSNVYRKEVIEY